MNPKALACGLWLAVPLFLAALSAQAAQAADEKRPEFLNESLAVQIEADEAELSEERDVSIYRGHVHLVRGPLSMYGDELRIQRDAPTGRIEATLSGKPARAIHVTAQDAIPVSASALRIVYTTIDEILELNGNASIQRGADQLQGDSVRYDVANARIQADGGKDRVRIIINPPKPTP
jgi:lipopolysaccharide export system protein LptA